jgi:hypothetical protein
MAAGGVQRKGGRKNRKHKRNFRAAGTLTASTSYIRSGGPGRMARRKAAAHGCNLPGLHLGKHGDRDQGSHFSK